MTMTNIERILELWTAGNKAPYDLFESTRVLRDAFVLVEAMVPPGPVFIHKGDLIDDVLELRIRKQVDPAPLPAITTHVLERNDDGTPKLDADGNAVTREVTIQPDAEIAELSVFEEPILPIHDMHCDQCGNLREENQLFKIGEGWYCKVPRVSPGENAENARTCFDRRLEQMA